MLLAIKNLVRIVPPATEVCGLRQNNVPRMPKMLQMRHLIFTFGKKSSDLQTFQYRNLPQLFDSALQCSLIPSLHGTHCKFCYFLATCLVLLISLSILCAKSPRWSICYRFRNHAFSSGITEKKIWN